MAPKRTGSETKGSNKIRFVMLEADLSDGNLAELTQAITNALKPAPAPVRYISAPAAAALNGAPVGAHVLEDEDELLEEVDDESPDPVTTSGKASRPAGKKKFKQPEFVELDWVGTGGPTFKEFASARAPKSKNGKYLVAAFWLKEYGGSPTINADKVYSCFKTAGWSVAISDWSQTFRNLVFADQLRKTGTPGEFSITTIGEGALEKAED
jgi:ribosomal protein L12E/L44/L45/RPP1/RPP2